MAHKFDVSARKKLDGEERRKLLQPHDTLVRLGFTGNETMADIGCGTGLFTFQAALISSQGAKIYAVDISQEMLDEVMTRAEKKHLQNIVPVKSEEYDSGLKDKSADFVLMCTVLHEVDDKPRLLSEAARICREGGTIAVIEFSEAYTNFGPPVGHRVTRTHVEELLKDTGLSFVQDMDISEAFYAVTAKKQGK